MSYDLAVWEGERPASDQAGAQAFEAQCDRYLEGVEWQPASELIAKYVAALLERWHDLTEDEDETSPWSTGPLIREANGPFIYFPMVYSRCEEVSKEAAEIAASMGLVCFDPQLQKLRP